MVKKELECAPNQDFDRKPVRRRMARDIYFVFEEGKKKCSKMRGSHKSNSKLSHLKVGEIYKNGTYNTKNVLYSLKNKGKCFVNANYSITQKSCSHSHASQMQYSIGHLPIAHLPIAHPKVNPVFVWVKQDDTRIVEVRCEDYDKRNRIRLTKTLNGWRSTPRTDSSSSRVVKLIPKTLRKVTLDTQSANHKKKDKMQFSLSKYKRICNTSDYCDKNIKRNKNDEVKRKRTSFVTNESNSDQPDVTLHSIDNKVNFSKDLDCKHIKKRTNRDTDENANSSRNKKIDNSNDKNKLQTSIDELFVSELQLCPETGLFIPKVREELSKINEFVKDREDSDILDLKAETDKIQKGYTKNLTDLLIVSNLIQNCANNDNSASDLLNSLVKKKNLLGRNCVNDASSGSELISSLVQKSCDHSLIDCYDKEDANNEDLNEISKQFLQPFSQILSHIRNPITDTLDCPNLSEDCEIESLNVDMFKNDVSECPNVNDTVKIEDLNVDLLQNCIPECSTLNEDIEIEGLNVDLFHNGHSECDSFRETGEIGGLNLDVFRTGSFVDVNKEKNVISEGHQFIPNILTHHKKNQLGSNVALRNCTEVSPEDLSYRKIEVPFSALRNKFPIMSSNVLKSCSNSAHIIKQTSNVAPFNSLQTQQTEPVNLGRKSKLDYSNDFCSNCLETYSGDIYCKEPIQKRVRRHESINKFKLKEQNDPDPLTQLKILIQNSQCKLPDPILVPKERLGAILESPAREIPHLLSTRPELKLPEAFSYPEILKNPNILVISIAQLEAILRVEMESKIQSTELTNVFTHPFSTGHNKKKSQNNVERIERFDFPNYNHSETINCNQIGACFKSDLITARLAILNKMLCLPNSYGRMSSDVLQFIKDESISQKNTNSSYFLSLCNQQLLKAKSDEDYDKNINTPMILKQNDHISASLDNPSGKTDLLRSELPTLEELLQSKMHSIHSITKIIGENIIASSNKTRLNQKTFAVLTSHKDFKIIKESIMKKNSLSNVRSICNPTNKSPFVSSINNNVDLNNITLYKNLSNNQKNIECKPKLTCKSLSNLIYPENIEHTTVPLVNLIASNDKYFCKYGDIEHENIIQNHIESYSSPTSVSTKCNKSVDGVLTEKTDSNAAQWHPILESNNKNGYCSPWQWTTITSPGE